MTEYTLVSLGMLVLAAALNLKFNPEFKNARVVWAAVGVAVLAQLVFDNLTVAAGFWEFNDAATLGIRLPFMPLENLFFGAGLFLFTVLSWEMLAGNKSDYDRDKVSGKSS